MTARVVATGGVGRDTKLTIGLMARASLWVVYASDWPYDRRQTLEDGAALNRQLRLERELRARSVQYPSNG